MEKSCANCNNSVDDAWQYCPSCGQKLRLGRLTLGQVGNEAIQYITNIDKGILPLLRDLLLHPGVAAREYIAGKRKKHFSPLSFYLLVGTVMVIALSLSRPNVSHQIDDRQTLDNIDNADKREAVRNIYERRDKSSAFMSKYSDFVSIAAVPFIAFLFWISYKKLPYNYTEHLVACMYMVGFMNLVWALIFNPLSGLIAANNSKVTIIIETIHKIVEIVYFSIFYQNFTRGIGKESSIKSILASILVVFLWTFLTTALITLYITNGFFRLID